MLHTVVKRIKLPYLHFVKYRINVQLVDYCMVGLCLLVLSVCHFKIQLHLLAKMLNFPHS